MVAGGFCLKNHLWAGGFQTKCTNPIPTLWVMMPVLGLGAVRIWVKIYVLIDTPKCVRNFYYCDLKLYRARFTSNHLVLHEQSPSNVICCISHHGVASVCCIGLLERHLGLPFLVDKPMPLPLILSTLPPPLNAQPWPFKALLPLVRWRLSSRLHLVHWLVVALPVVTCLCLPSPFATQPLHASRQWQPSIAPSQSSSISSSFVP